MATWRSGGCLCGAVRFEVAAEGVFDAGYCHCSMCRRSTGAPVLAWALVRRDHFRITRGEPASFASSSACNRLFCRVCGGQVLYEAPNLPDVMGVHVATLEEEVPDALRPRLHMCTDDALSWLMIEDELPRFPSNQLTHPAQRRARPAS